MGKQAIASACVLVFGLSLLVSNAHGASPGQALQEDASIGKKNDMAEPVTSEGQPEPHPDNTTISPPTTPTSKPTVPTSKPTTTTVPSTSVKPNSTTTSTTATTSTTSAPTTSPTSTSTSGTTTSVTTTSAPTAAPSTHRGFDAFSFIGGFILAVGLMGIGMVSWKFYVSRQENYYHTL